MSLDFHGAALLAFTHQQQMPMHFVLPLGRLGSLVTHKWGLHLDQTCDLDHEDGILEHVSQFSQAFASCMSLVKVSDQFMSSRLADRKTFDERSFYHCPQQSDFSIGSRSGGRAHPSSSLPGLLSAIGENVFVKSSLPKPWIENWLRRASWHKDPAAASAGIGSQSHLE